MHTAQQLLAEWTEWASFPKFTQLYIRTSLLIHRGHANIAEIARNQNEEAELRLRTVIYKNLKDI